MDDPLGVSSLERGSDLCGKANGLIRRESLPLGRDDRQAVNKLHNQIIWADIVNLADVGMIQRCDGLGFPLETFAELRGGKLDRNVAIQSCIPGAINFTHSARADERKDLVRAESFARW